MTKEPIVPLRSLKDLERRMATPPMRTLEAARAAIGKARSAQEAWEALITREVFPASWIDDPARKFYRGMAGSPAHRPTNTGCCERFAADVPSIVQAEALAKEVGARLAPFGVPPVETILWRIDHGYGPNVVGKPIEAIHRALAKLPWSIDELPLHIRNIEFMSRPLVTAEDAVWSEVLWDLAAKRNWSLTIGKNTVALGENANPFTPLSDLWELGYKPVSFLASRALLFVRIPTDFGK